MTALVNLIFEFVRQLILKCNQILIDIFDELVVIFGDSMHDGRIEEPPVKQKGLTIFEVWQQNKKRRHFICKLEVLPTIIHFLVVVLKSCQCFQPVTAMILLYLLVGFEEILEIYFRNFYFVFEEGDYLV